MARFLSILFLISSLYTASAQESIEMKLHIFDKLDMNNPLEKNNQSFVYNDTTHSYDFKFDCLKNKSNVVPDSLFYTIWIYCRGFCISYQINSKFSINEALIKIYKKFNKRHDLFLSIDSVYVMGKIIKQPEIIGEKYFIAIPRTERIIYFNNITDLKKSIKNNDYKSEIYTNKDKPVFVIKYKTKTAPNTAYK